MRLGAASPDGGNASWAHVQMKQRSPSVSAAELPCPVARSRFCSLSVPVHLLVHANSAASRGPPRRLALGATVLRHVAGVLPAPGLSRAVRIVLDGFVHVHHSEPFSPAVEFLSDYLLCIGGRRVGAAVSAPPPERLARFRAGSWLNS